METILDEKLPRSRLAVLLKHFSQIEDDRQSWRVAFPLAAMLPESPHWRVPPCCLQAPPERCRASISQRSRSRPRLLATTPLC